MPPQPTEHPEINVPEQLVWNLDWNLLRTFMVIVQEQGITAAARKLGLKQPTVSNALKRLEGTLGCELVERGPRTFEVTSQGRALYKQSAGIFGSVSRLAAALEEASDEITGTVQLSMASHVQCPLLDESLEIFHRAHPDACIQIDISSSKEVIQSMLEKKASAGICLVRDRIPELDYTLLYTEHFGFFCGPRHPLFGKQGLRLEDLRRERSVSFHTDQLNDVLQPIAILRAQANFDEKIAGVSSNLEEVRRMVIAGLGVGALPIHVAERDVREGQLFRLPPYADPPAIDIWMVLNPAASLNQAEREFIRLLSRRIDQTPIAKRRYGYA
jgi:DNA-binding transcriptional LysR family regulator